MKNLSAQKKAIESLSVCTLKPAGTECKSEIIDRMVNQKHQLRRMNKNPANQAGFYLY